MNLDSQVVVITGGSKGLGRVLAASLKGRGAQVVICSRNKEEVEAAAQEMGVLGLVADVTDESQLAAVAEQAVAQFGRIDLWINNAGVWMPKQPIEAIDVARAKKLFDINVFGTIHGMRVASRHMRPRGKGIIVNISSVTAFDGMAGTSGSMYIASKYALRGLINAEREEMRSSGIQVLGAYPGGFQSDLFDDELSADLVKTFMTAESVAEKIVANLESEHPLEQLVMPRPGQAITNELAGTTK
jgi:NAD(P)-dependent dehydrogenase (short-subunit alcohol dehydrogenase family)